MKFSIIGSGNIAWFLGTRLAAGGHQCTAVYARNQVAAKELAEALLCEKSGEINDIIDGLSDICFICVSDSAVSHVAKSISLEKTILVHTAGAVDIDVLKPAANDRAVLWPVYSILKNNLPNHRNIPCVWEASSEKAQEVLFTAAHSLTDALFEATFKQRKWLHLSAVIGNNFVNHLLTICEKICQENNVPFSILQPIIEQTFERTKHISPQQLQTGPAIRHDDLTTDRQMALLKDHQLWQQVYGVLTKSIQEVK